MVGTSARNMGIDLADLRKMASEAGDGTPFLVIQAIGKKSSLRLTSISRLEKATWKIGTGAPPRIAVHQSADFPVSAKLTKKYDVPYNCKHCAHTSLAFTTTAKVFL